jgi:predicted membrane protein
MKVDNKLTALSAVFAVAFAIATFYAPSTTNPTLQAAANTIQMSMLILTALTVSTVVFVKFLKRKL